MPSALIVEDDVDIDGTPGSGTQPREHELAEELVGDRDLALTLQHGDLGGGLIVLTVVKTWCALVGTVVFLEMIFWKKPPAIAMPRLCGVTSRSSISCSSCSSMAPWMAAPGQPPRPG